MKKLEIFTPVTLANIPSFAYWLLNVPSIAFHYVSCLIFKKNFSQWLTRKRYVNEIRLACRNYSEKDDQERKTLKVSYRHLENAVRVKVRFEKKAIKGHYEHFKETVELHTNVCTSFKREKGYMLFDIMVALEPLEQVQASKYSVSIGTGFDGLVCWDWVHFPHLLVVAETGQGKSSFIRYLLNGLNESDINVWLVDGKGIDYFSYQQRFKKYISNEVSNIDQLIDFVHQFRLQMLDRQQLLKQKGVTDFTLVDGLNTQILIIEELIVIIDSMDKKQRALFEEDLQAILLLGRAIGFDLVVTMQRGDTAYIKGSMRDNFECRLLLGSATSTSYTMMFGEAKHPLPVGQAWLKQGNHLEVVAIPYVDHLTTRSLAET